MTHSALHYDATIARLDMFEEVEAALVGFEDRYKIGLLLSPPSFDIDPGAVLHLEYGPDFAQLEPVYSADLSRYLDTETARMIEAAQAVVRSHSAGTGTVVAHFAAPIEPGDGYDLVMIPSDRHIQIVVVRTSALTSADVLLTAHLQYPFDDELSQHQRARVKCSCGGCSDNCHSYF